MYSVHMWRKIRHDMARHALILTAMLLAGWIVFAGLAGLLAG